MVRLSGIQGFFPQSAAPVPGDASITPRTSVDLLLANILAQPLIEFAPKFAKLVKANGQIVLSGILEQQAEDVVNAYQADFDLEPPVTEDEWVLITGRRKT